MGVIDDSFILDTTPLATRRFDLPGSDEYYCVATQFNTSAQTLHYWAAVEGDGSVIVAMLVGGIIDFRLPGRDKNGNIVPLVYSADRQSNIDVYQLLAKAPALQKFLTDAVGELNPQIYREQTAEQAAEAKAEIEAKREERAEIESEIGDDKLPLDPNASPGAPECCSAETATPSACSTPSNAVP